MKKILYITIFLIGFAYPINGAEKRDCSNIKKLSKTYISCKSGNVKISVVKTGSKIKSGTISKTNNFKKSLNNPFKKKG
jgi:hypothetical protein|tara:strand:- start:505 stop:741 length:237 start_codon:yes stop_codon:yes gene_type:complete